MIYMRLVSFGAARALADGNRLARDERTNNLVLSRLNDALRLGDECRCWLFIDDNEPQLAPVLDAGVSRRRLWQGGHRALADLLLASGQHWVALFADNANATSMGI